MYPEDLTADDMYLIFSRGIPALKQGRPSTEAEAEEPESAEDED